ncbi:GAF domain-containing protein [Ramlibacter sp. AW1]|uniref:GAF domain-containing protein n=2 Tax=Ramlibacter aurantiacus TaxID=2801330 RepID=A0A936ZD78_9BURK|nr:GAF domain-containing protein [Ramlibacter aurantiacus]
MPEDLRTIRACFEGGVPCTLASADAQGEPNVVFVSQAEWVDERHIALSFQFFNKTRRNILVNPHVQLILVHPTTGEQFRIAARYLRTEFEGPLFERMRAKLAGIASHTGMGGVFKLLGADLYEVLDLERVRTTAIVPRTPAPERMPALRRACEHLSVRADLEDLFDRCMQALERHFGLRHAMLLLPDAPRRRLYTMASLGYARSGVGSEIALGDGVIGVAAQSGTPIRINHLTQDASYCRAARVQGPEGQSSTPEREIAYPGLAEPHSQMALPIAWGAGLPAVLFVESEQAMCFDWDLEDALSVFCLQLGAHLRALQPVVEAPDEAAPPPATPAAAAAPGSTGHAPPLRVRFFEVDSSVFLDDEYVIKGVAGAVLWTLVSEYQATGRTEFTNRELRLRPALRLPDLNDNLEARLVLLRRRLAERRSDLQIEKIGRGRLRLQLQRGLELTPVPRTG